MNPRFKVIGIIILTGLLWAGGQVWESRAIDWKNLKADELLEIAKDFRQEDLGLHEVLSRLGQPSSVSAEETGPGSCEEHPAANAVPCVTRITLIYRYSHRRAVPWSPPHFAQLTLVFAVESSVVKLESANVDATY